LQTIAFEHDGRQYQLASPRPPERDFIRSFLVLVLRPPFLWILLLTAIALSVVLSIAIAGYLVHPLRTIEDAGRRLSQGDLTARVGPALGRRRDEIAEFAATFDQMAERIESLVSAHKDLLRDVSHELRSPLARAHAALSLVRQRPNEALDDNLDRVETELERVNGMIGRLLTFSRLDSGEKPMQKEPVELVDLLHGIVQASRLEAEPSGKCVTVHDDEPIVVPGDPELLASCFENVIRNAIRHTPANTAVEISLSRNDGTAQYCCVTVRDHGNGVSEPQLRRIFDPFYRVHPGGTGLNGGSGIGLAIAKRAISWHEGSISAANAPDGGLIVSILLPMYRDDVSGTIS
jgi:two-component system sensor histidine kinase CpxA